MIEPALYDRWHRDGFFILRGLVPKADAAEIEGEVIERIRSDPPERHAGAQYYMSGDDYLIYGEKAPSPSAINPEDRISKVFNCHTEGATRRVAES
jgi:hypothetical protein